MIISASVPTEPSQDKDIIDKFLKRAYNEPEIMKFIRATVAVIDCKATGQLALHFQEGNARRGEANFKL